MRAWLNANGGALALVVVGIGFGGFTNAPLGVALIAVGAAWFVGSRLRLVGRYVPRLRLTWVPAEKGPLRRRRAENVEERAVRLAHEATAEPEPPARGHAAATGDDPSAQGAVRSTPRVESAASRRASAPRADVQELLTEGETLKTELLAARRERTTNPLGINPAVNRVAHRVRVWNERVAEVVDGSNLPFQTKMRLAVYQDPTLGIIGASAERVGNVLENNIGLLRQL